MLLGTFKQKKIEKTNNRKNQAFFRIIKSAQKLAKFTKKKLLQSKGNVDEREHDWPKWWKSDAAIKRIVRLILSLFVETEDLSKLRKRIENEKMLNVNIDTHCRICNYPKKEGEQIADNSSGGRAKNVNERLSN